MANVRKFVACVCELWFKPSLSPHSSYHYGQACANVERSSPLFSLPMPFYLWLTHVRCCQDGEKSKSLREAQVLEVNVMPSNGVPLAAFHHGRDRPAYIAGKGIKLPGWGIEEGVKLETELRCDPLLNPPLWTPQCPGEVLWLHGQGRKGETRNWQKAETAVPRVTLPESGNGWKMKYPFGMESFSYSAAQFWQMRDRSLWFVKVGKQF